MKSLTKDQIQSALEILGINKDKSIDISHFSDAKVRELNQLIEEGLIDVKDRHNGAPRIATFLKTMEIAPKSFVVSGYIITDHKRPDAHISIDAIAFSPHPLDMPSNKRRAVEAFKRMKAHYPPDEYIERDRLMCMWWD